MKKLYYLYFIILFLLLMPNVYAAEIKTGTYKIRSASDESKILVENNGNIELGDEDSTGTTTWDIYSNGSSFSIKSSNDNSISISVDSGNIKTDNFENNSNQQFYFVHTESKQNYYIRSVLGNYNIDISMGSIEVGTNIQLYSHNGTAAQIWKLERINDEEPIIEDGTYIVRANNNSSNVLDLSGGYVRNNGNIQVYSNNFTLAQLWSIKYENGYYKIYTTLDENMCFDIQEERLKSGSNIQLYQSKDINAQKWLIEANDDNTYSISSYDGLWKMDISGGSSSSGANIQIYQTNGTAAQKFIIEKSSIEYLENGYYTIGSPLGTDMVIGIDGSQVINQKNVVLTNDSDEKYTKWYINRVQDDIYTISNAGNKKKVLDVAGGNTASRSNVQLYQKNGTSAQKWRIRKNGDDTYTFIGVGSGKVLDVDGALSEKNTNIQIYSSNGTLAQKFTLTPVTINEYETIKTDKYLIKSNISQDKVFDVSGGKKDNNTNIWLHTQNNTNAQIWKIESIGEGEHLIRSMINPNIVLSASSSNVVIRKYNSSDEQKWYFMYDGNDELVLYNLGTGKFLTFEGTTNGANISLTETQSENNEIILTPYTDTLKYRGIDVSSHNGNVDWEKIRNDIDFAIIRAGYSSEVIENDKDKYQDSKFLRNVEYCEMYNIPYALYLYSYAYDVDSSENSAVNEANHMLKLIEKASVYGSPNLSVPIYYDLEDDATYDAVNYDATTLTNINDKFCSIIEENGYQCGLYTFLNGFDYMGYDNVRTLASKYAIWVARWYWKDFDADEYQFPAINEDKSGFELKYNTKHKIWQFSAEGNMPGANTGNGRVDLNIGYDIFE